MPYSDSTITPTSLIDRLILAGQRLKLMCRVIVAHCYRWLPRHGQPLQVRQPSPATGRCAWARQSGKWATRLPSPARRRSIGTAEDRLRLRPALYFLRDSGISRRVRLVNLPRS